MVNALSGQVHYVQASKCGIKQLWKLYEALKVAYPDAEVIYLSEDNWPVQVHPTILKAFPEQETKFALKVSSSWKDVVGDEWKKEKLPMQIVPLPTYASWCNPLEKLWRWLQQEILHLHRQADNRDKLKEQIQELLNQVNQIVLDKNQQTQLALCSLLAGGHILFEDLPGLGKTTLASSLAHLADLQFKRIQFTNDMLASDVIGVNMERSATLPVVNGCCRMPARWLPNWRCSADELIKGEALGVAAGHIDDQA